MKNSNGASSVLMPCPLRVKRNQAFGCAKRCQGAGYRKQKMGGSWWKHREANHGAGSPALGQDGLGGQVQWALCFKVHQAHRQKHRWQKIKDKKEQMGGAELQCVKSNSTPLRQILISFPWPWQLEFLAQSLSKSKPNGLPAHHCKPKKLLGAKITLVGCSPKRLPSEGGGKRVGIEVGTAIKGTVNSSQGGNGFGHHSFAQ